MALDVGADRYSFLVTQACSIVAPRFRQRKQSATMLNLLQTKKHLPRLRIPLSSIWPLSELGCCLKYLAATKPSLSSSVTNFIIHSTLLLSSTKHRDCKAILLIILADLSIDLSQLGTFISSSISSAQLSCICPPQRVRTIQLAQSGSPSVRSSWLKHQHQTPLQPSNNQKETLSQRKLNNLLMNKKVIR